MVVVVVVFDGFNKVTSLVGFMYLREVILIGSCKGMVGDIYEEWLGLVWSGVDGEDGSRDTVSSISGGGTSWRCDYNKVGDGGAATGENHHHYRHHRGTSSEQESP